MEKNVQSGWLIEMMWEGKSCWWSMGQDENGYSAADIWTDDRELASVYSTRELGEMIAWNLGLDDVYMVEK
jgi:hypothetical protein